MAKKIDRAIIATVKKYVDAVSKDYIVDGAILFGSYARGTQRDESDIDVAILLSKMDNRFNERINLSRYTWDIDTRIEPHPIKTDDYKNGSSILASEIARTGIKII
jgi:predicted nucleotidyltransferase